MNQQKDASQLKNSNKNSSHSNRNNKGIENWGNEKRKT